MLSELFHARVLIDIKECFSQINDINEQTYFSIRFKLSLIFKDPASTEYLINNHLKSLETKILQDYFDSKYKKDTSSLADHSLSFHISASQADRKVLVELVKRGISKN